ncbi:MAG: J domain-containing protein, partial [Myxococcota bacterium]
MVTTVNLDAKPRIRSGIDLMQSGLSAEEGMLAARIDGEMTVRVLMQVMRPWPDDKTSKLLDRLSEAQVIVWGDEKELGPNIDILSNVTPDYGDFVFPPALMGDENDLPLPHRKKIAWFHEHLDEWNHYELLQVSRLAEKSVIRRAYYERSKEWHPDRFRFADNLGA